MKITEKPLRVKICTTLQIQKFQTRDTWQTSLPDSLRKEETPPQSAIELSA